MKRLTAKQYAVNLLDVMEALPAKEQPAAAQRFFQLLQRRRLIRLLPRILSNLEAESYRRAGVLPVTARAARDLPATTAQQLTKQLGQPVVLTAVTDPTLTAGVQFTVGETLIDSSLKALLTSLRQRLTNHTTT